MSNGASDETYTQSKIDISGSNETMQNALASIVKVWRIFEIFSMFQEFQKFELIFHPIWGKSIMGVTWVSKQHRIFLK